VPKREKAKMLAEMSRAQAHSQALNMAQLLENDEKFIASILSAHCVAGSSIGAKIAQLLRGVDLLGAKAASLVIPAPKIQSKLV